MEHLPCICCGHLMKNIMEDSGHQPIGGISFSSYGHYGTVFFDPGDGSFIEVAICDECMISAEQEGRVVYSNPAEKPDASDLHLMQRVVRIGRKSSDHGKR